MKIETIKYLKGLQIYGRKQLHLASHFGLSIDIKYWTKYLRDIDFLGEVL